jgi:hypothetical protein
LRDLVKAQSRQDPRSPCRGGIGIDCNQAFVDIAQQMRVMFGFGLGQQVGALYIGGQHGFKRRGISAGRFLRDIAQTAAARHIDRTGVGVDFADQRFDKSRFARAVASNQTDFATGGNGGAGTRNDIAPAKAHGQVRNGQHGPAPSITRGWRRFPKFSLPR